MRTISNPLNERFIPLLIQSCAMAAGLAFVGQAHAAELKIENEFLRVVLEDQSLTVQSKPTSRTFIPKAVFSRKIESATVQSRIDPAWGAGSEVNLTHADGWTTQIRLYPQQPFIFFQTVAGNQTDQPISHRMTELMTWDLDLGVPVGNLRTLGTAGLRGLPAAGSYTYLAVADPESRRGVVSGWLTHERGVGVFFPKEDPAEPVAKVSAQIDFGHFQVNPGRTRLVDTMLLGYFEDARLGLEQYADAVARQYAIRLKPQPSVYCTWYHAGASNEDRLAQNTEFADQHLKRFGFNTMQIDDKWQAILPKGFKHDGKIKTTGPIKVFVDSNNNYPKGMAHTADNITQQGLVPGIWFMPFAGNYENPYFDREIFATNPDGTPFHDRRWSGTCLDLTNPKAQDFVADLVKRIHGWGYRYFKLDGLHTGAPSYNIYVHKEYRRDCFPDSRLKNPGMPHIEAYRKGLQIVRQNAPDTFVLGCNVSQNLICMGPSFGLLDAMRIGPDNGSAGGGNWGAVKVGAWHGSTLYFLNGRVWHNDPDPVYVRPSNPLSKARLMCSWVAVSGSMLTVSEQFADLPPDRLDLIKRTTPGHGALGRPVDLFEADQARIWLLSDERTNVRRDVIGLFNWDEKNPAEIDYELGRLGLDRNQTYAAFDYWENQFIPPFKGALKQTLPGATCRILAVRPVADHPQLLSTSRHITQGILEVTAETWDATTRTLAGRSKVVAGDPYQLRVAIPPGGSWTVKSLSADGAEISLGETSALGIRVSIESPRNQEVAWKIAF